MQDLQLEVLEMEISFTKNRMIKIMVKESFQKSQHEMYFIMRLCASAVLIEESWNHLKIKINVIQVHRKESFAWHSMS